MSGAPAKWRVLRVDSEPGERAWHSILAPLADGEIDGETGIIADTSNRDDSISLEQDARNAECLAACTEMLAAIKDAHQTMDWLFASLIQATSGGRTFLPSQSPAWAPFARLAELVRRLDPKHRTRKEDAPDGRETTEPV